jgi:transcriptional regulator with XRE-family HTH domain
MSTSTKPAKTSKAKAKAEADKNVRSASPTDAIIGERIRVLRTQQKMSQAELGDALGVSFQQVQKYEKGMNRVGTKRLIQIADHLECPVSHFYDGLTGAEKPRSEQATAFAQYVASREGVSIIEALIAIESAHIRHQVISLARKIANCAE